MKIAALVSIRDPKAAREAMVRLASTKNRTVTTGAVFDGTCELPAYPGVIFYRFTADTVGNG